MSEETYGAFEVRFSVIDVVGVLEKKSSEAEASFDFDDGEKRHRALANGLEAFYSLPYLPPLLVLLRQRPQPFRHRFHRRRYC